MLKPFLVLAAFIAVAVVRPAGVLAASPTNDAFAGATIVASLPFSDTVDVSEATSEPGEPACTGPPEAQTVWYRYTPSTDQVLRARVENTSFGTTLIAFQSNGTGLGGLGSVSGCTYFGNNVVVFAATAGTTYYFRAAAYPFSAGGSLDFRLEEVPPPANDAFADAKPIGALPFADDVDTSGASLQADEPTPSCGYGAPSGSVWYSFKPGQTGSVSASVPFSGFWSEVAVYRGTSLGGLQQIGCRTFGQLLTFKAVAGETYYFQVGGIFGARGQLRLTVDVAPLPVVQIGSSLSDPSIFDTVQFYDFSYDPAGVGIESRSWDFGDGEGSTEPYPTHRYHADGDYALKLTVTTFDGRTATRSLLVRVRTHDVAITRFTVPQSASADQTRTLSVDVSNARYGETVQVQLLKSVPGGGFQQVGVLTQSVPVRTGGRTTDFKFSYTFTADDAAVGKVTFQAVATIVGARDAIPGDNTAIALPTSVNR